jgi:HAD superfamily hydrolase (TIGR01490 family)
MSVQRKRIARSVRPRRAAAFYDLDGTLVELNLVHLTAHMMANVGEWTRRAGYVLSFIARLPRLYFAEKQDRGVLNVVMFEAFKGISRDRLLELGEEYCDRVLERHVFPQAGELIDANRAAGLEAVLVTGSPDFVVAPFARRFGIEHFAANRLVFSRGHATGALARPIMAGAEKAMWCADFARQRGLDLARCWGYADSHYDLPFLAALGHPIAVNPDRKLERAAMTRQWPILRFERPETGLADDLAALGIESPFGRIADGAS